MATDTMVKTDEREDAELLTAIAETRDAAAFNELFERHQRAAYNLALHLTGAREAAEETVQEAMLRVWTSAATYRATGAVKSWILKIVAREALSFLKSKRRNQKEMERDIKREGHTKRGADDEAGELIGALRDRLNQLPEIERQLLGLHFSGGLSQQEIGEALAMPQQTVSYKITEALKRLRTSLSAAGLTAVVPLIENSGLSEAICSGHAAPATLQAKVMAAVSGTKAAAASVARHSLRAKKAATAGSKASAWLATVTIVTTAIAAAVVMRPQANRPPPAPAPVVAPIPVPAPIDPLNAPIPHGEPDFHKRWSFADGAKADLYTAMSEWTWDSAEKAMAATKYMKVIVPFSLPANPVKITARGKIIKPTESGTYGFMLMQDGPMVQPRTWKREFKAANGFVEYTTYIFDPYLVEYFNDTLSRVVEFKNPHDRAIPVLSVQNSYIYEIEMRGIKLEDIPAAIRDPLKLTEGMKMMRPEDDPGLQKKPPTGE